MSFAGASESDIVSTGEGQGGACRDYDLDEIADFLGIDNMERLNSIMNGDSNRDPAAYMDAMFEAFTEASQNPMNNFMGNRAHAPSGFELESNLEDIYALMELRSSVAGK